MYSTGFFLIRPLAPLRFVKQKGEKEKKEKRRRGEGLGIQDTNSSTGYPVLNNTGRRASYLVLEEEHVSDEAQLSLVKLALI